MAIAPARRAKGSLTSIGHYRAVAEVFGLRVSELPAWFTWRGFHILRLSGFATKLRVTLNWLLCVKNLRVTIGK